jgi:hypothetical protein
MRTLLTFAAAIMLLGATTDAQPDPLARARALHKQVPLIDGHNDYPRCAVSIRRAISRAPTSPAACRS